MAHFAQLDANSVVIEVIVINNDVVQNLPFPESEPIGVAFCQSLYGADTAWKQTSYNANFRKNYAGIGYTYNATLDAFISPQPAPECTLDPVTCQWICPPPVVNEPVAAQLADIENATLPPEEAP